MRNSRAILIIGVALLLALGAVVLAAKWMGEQGPAGTRVVVAAADIGQGARILPASLQLADWPAGALPPGAITEEPSFVFVCDSNTGSCTRTATAASMDCRMSAAS